MKDSAPNTKHNNANGGNFINGVLIGTVIGVAVSALLISPDKKENRKKLKSVKDKSLDKSRELYEIIQTDVLPALEELKPLIDETKAKAKPVVKETATKITQLADFSMEKIDKQLKQEKEKLIEKEKEKRKPKEKKRFFRGSF